MESPSASPGPAPVSAEHGGGGTMTGEQPCGQEPRLAVMESALANISATLADLKDIMVAQATTSERILTLQQRDLDQEMRLRKLEHGLATGKWTERVVWVLVSLGLAGYFGIASGGGK